MSNVFSFTGSLGQDSELKEIGQGTALQFSVANNVGFGDRKTTQWVRCLLWGKRGESLSQYLKKGTKVFVSGEMKLNTYTNKEGVEKSSLEMNVSVCDLLGSKSEDSAPAPQAPQKDDNLPF